MPQPPAGAPQPPVNTPPSTEASQLPVNTPPSADAPPPSQQTRHRHQQVCRIHLEVSRLSGEALHSQGHVMLVGRRATPQLDSWLIYQKSGLPLCRMTYRTHDTPMDISAPASPSSFPSPQSPEFETSLRESSLALCHRKSSQRITVRACQPWVCPDADTDTAEVVVQQTVPT